MEKKIAFNKNFDFHECASRQFSPYKALPGTHQIFAFLFYSSPVIMQ